MAGEAANTITIQVVAGGSAEGGVAAGSQPGKGTKRPATAAAAVAATAAAKTPPAASGGGLHATKPSASRNLGLSPTMQNLAAVRTAEQLLSKHRKFESSEAAREKRRYMRALEKPGENIESIFAQMQAGLDTDDKRTRNRAWVKAMRAETRAAKARGKLDAIDARVHSFVNDPKVPPANKVRGGKASRVMNTVATAAYGRHKYNKTFYQYTKRPLVRMMEISGLRGAGRLLTNNVGAQTAGGLLLVAELIEQNLNNQLVKERAENQKELKRVMGSPFSLRNHDVRTITQGVDREAALERQRDAMQGVQRGAIWGAAAFMPLGPVGMAVGAVVGATAFGVGGYLTSTSDSEVNRDKRQRLIAKVSAASVVFGERYIAGEAMRIAFAGAPPVISPADQEFIAAMRNKLTGDRPTVFGKNIVGSKVGTGYYAELEGVMNADINSKNVSRMQIAGMVESERMKAAATVRARQ